jgi:hypothetical protein
MSSTTQLPKCFLFTIEGMVVQHRASVRIRKMMNNSLRKSTGIEGLDEIEPKTLTFGIMEVTFRVSPENPRKPRNWSKESIDAA